MAPLSTRVVIAFILTTSAWMAVGHTQTYPLVSGIPGRDGREGGYLVFLAHLEQPAHLAHLVAYILNQLAYPTTTPPVAVRR